MQHPRRNGLMLVVAVVGALVILGGTALASWTTTGSGSSRAVAKTSLTLTVDAAVGAADLYPGFNGGDVWFTLTNPNPYPVQFTSMSPGSVTSSNAASCPSSNVTVASKSGLSITVAANATSATLSIADVIGMSASAPDACQGVVFSVSITLTGVQT